MVVRHKHSLKITSRVKPFRVIGKDLLTDDLLHNDSAVSIKRIVNEGRGVSCEW